MVVSAGALHYFDQPEVSLGEMRRVLKGVGAGLRRAFSQTFFGE
jgi:hypothetical protein